MIKCLNILQSSLIVGVVIVMVCISQAQNNAPSATQNTDGTHMSSIQNPPQYAPSFSLSINTKATEYHVGSRVSIDVTMKNITKHTIDHSDWYSDAGESCYSIDVRDEDGKPAERILREHPELDTPGYYWGAIPSGESITSQLRISRIYKFDRPGKYAIQVSRPDPDFQDANEKPVVVKSNIITITITG